MGYDLHIVKRSDWENYEEESKISLSEWLSYINSDNELELTNGYQIKNPESEDNFQNAPGFCNWVGHSIMTGENTPWFEYGYGMISTKNPDNETIKKMLEIAKAFDGKVQGDDGEFYDATYFVNKASELSSNENKNIKRPWWKFW